MNTINLVCQYPTGIVMGGAALIGALIAAGITINKKRKEKGWKFDWKRMADTIWQSSALGLAAAQGVQCGAYGILLACVGGIGIDKITNKLGIKEVQLLNVVQVIGNWFDKKK